MRQFSYTITNILDDDADFFANDITDADGTAATLAATATTDLLAHKVIITPSGAISGNFTLTGTDADDNAISETLATDTVNAVTSAKFYKTLTSVIMAAVGTETIDIGITDDAVSKTILLDPVSPHQAGVMVDTNATTADWTIQETLEKIHGNSTSPAQLTSWMAITAFTGKTADVASTATLGSSAIRLLLNSASASTCDITIHVSQRSGGAR